MIVQEKENLWEAVDAAKVSSSRAASDNMRKGGAKRMEIWRKCCISFVGEIEAKVKSEFKVGSLE